MSKQHTTVTSHGHHRFSCNHRSCNLASNITSAHQIGEEEPLNHFPSSPSTTTAVATSPSSPTISPEKKKTEPELRHCRSSTPPQLPPSSLHQLHGHRGRANVGSRGVAVIAISISIASAETLLLERENALPCVRLLLDSQTGQLVNTSQLVKVNSQLWSKLQKWLNERGRIGN